MKKSFALLAICALAFLGVAATPDESSAVPAFARQTGNTCWSCHFQRFPKLTAMGRDFKLGGYTDAAVDLMEDDFLSIPAVMPLSMIVKMQYKKYEPKESSGEKAGYDRGRWKIVDEVAFYMGGRLGQNIGVALEYAEGHWAKGNLVLAYPMGDNKVGLTFYAADGAGPGGAMEVMNTGWLRGGRHWEMRSEIVVGNPIYGEATGIVAFVGGSLFNVSAGLWGPAWYGERDVDSNFDLALQYRAVFTPSVGAWDLGIGVIGSSGEAKCVDCLGATELQTIKVNFIGGDFQAQTTFGNGMTLEILAAYLSFPDDPSTDANTHVQYTKGSRWGASAELGVTKRTTVKAAYLNNKNDNNDKEENWTGLGMHFSQVQNLTWSIEYMIGGGDATHDSKLLGMIFFAF